MRTTTFAFLFSLLTTLSNAQEIGHIGFGGPQTRVVVLNATDDNSPIWAQIGDKAKKEPLPRGGQWGRAFSYGMTGGVAVNVTICPAAEAKTIHNSPIYPPAWAADEERFGKNALTDKFIKSDPDKKEVEERVRAIRRMLKKKLGKEKIEQLDGWVRTTKDFGMTPTITGCANPEIINLVQDVSQWGNERTILVTIRGSQAVGYRRDVQQ